MKRTSFILPLFYFMITFILLILPGNEFPKSEFFLIKGLDKIVHTFMFFMLTWLFCRPIKESGMIMPEKQKWFFIIVILAIFYGTLMEVVQLYFVPFRSFELADILFDSLGALFGYLSVRVKLKRWQKSRPR